MGFIGTQNEVIEHLKSCIYMNEGGQAVTENKTMYYEMSNLSIAGTVTAAFRTKWLFGLCFAVEHEQTPVGIKKKIYDMVDNEFLRKEWGAGSSPCDI